MVSMLVFYARMNDHGLASLYAFLLNWLFFNVAAPLPYTSYAAPIWPSYAGYFEPSLANYLTRPVSFGLTVLVCGLLAAVVLLRKSARPVMTAALALVLGLLAYTLVRAAFFFVFNPAEALQFSPAAVLAHLLLFAMLLAAVEFSGKRLVLAAIAALLLMTNSTFIFLTNTGFVPLPQQQEAPAQPFHQQPAPQQDQPAPQPQPLPPEQQAPQQQVQPSTPQSN